MLDSQRDPTHPERGAALPDFPHAPIGWMPDDARLVAKQEDLILTELHWQVIRALQEYFSRQDETGIINRIELHDALEEKFHHQGGVKFLYQIFPKGPMAQGCRIAGLTPPSGAVVPGFGSVM